MSSLSESTIVENATEGSAAIALAQKTWTEAEFMALSKDGGRYELVDGDVVTMSNSGLEHGEIGLLLGGRLIFYVREHKLGSAFDSSTGFRMQSGNVRSPDVGFIAKARLQGLKRPPKGFFEGAPDLAVEVLSPSNTLEEIHNKIVEYFENGTRLIWVINPQEYYVLVYHTSSPDVFLRVGDDLDGEDVVPGFSMAIAELFAEWEF
jgi:Uma2 family endonuclease